MIANKVKPKVQKVIDKFPTQVTILRQNLNEFNEPIGEEVVISVKGFYHESNNQMGNRVSDKGKVKVDKQKFLMVVYDENTVKIKENDYFVLDNSKFRIIDLGNQNRLNIYFDMLLEEF